MPFRRTNNRSQPGPQRYGRRAWQPAAHCSGWVLANLGLLAITVPGMGLAQTARTLLPAGTVPVVRNVVTNNATVHAPVSNAGGGRSLRIEQSGQRAIINWQNFNIARDSDVTFYHPSVTASTLNRIVGNEGPSVVQGLLQSRLTGTDRPGGQVMLINQNGILFDRGSQVNVGSLIASSLNITNERFLSGVLVSATDAAFEGGYDANGAPLPARPDGTRPGAISIGSFGPDGAAAPTIEAAPGGSIMLFAPSIDNASGIIRSPDGQVILAAGKKVYLSANPNAGDTTLRGFVVEVAADEGGPGVNLSSLIRNAGSISADRGNVSLAALAVKQEGRITADTAVQLNGSIFLKARARSDDGSVKAGAVTLAAGSVTAVDPDLADTSTMVEAQDYTNFRGVIDVQGGTIASSGTVRATGGRVSLEAADAADPTAARVYLDAGSITSAAGAWADVDFAKNFVTFRATSNELKNSPDQKTGVLRGANVTVDLRRDNNILVLDGYRDTVARTVAEKAAKGGEISISSTGSVVQRAGATLDVSGGGYRYAGGVATTTRLLGADGKIYDIATAPQALRYIAQLDRHERRYERWGQTDTYVMKGGTHEAAYAEGKAGGVLKVGSRAGLVLDGTMLGGVTVGARQLSRAPTGATLRIGDGIRSDGTYNARQLIGNMHWRQQAADSLGAAFDLGTALTSDQQQTLSLAATQVFGPAAHTDRGRVEQGFGIVELNSNGVIVVPDGVSITSDVGAELMLRAPRVDLGGDIRLPAGSLTIATVPDAAAALPEAVAQTERITVRSTAELSTAGAWINNASRDGSFVGEPTPSGRIKAIGSVKSSLDGGDIALRVDEQSHETRLENGAVLDVGGGASMNRSRRVTGGIGGKLDITNGSAGQSTSDWLLASLRGFSLTNGGELTLNLAQALITPDNANGVLPASTTRLEAGLFSDLGFSKVTVKALGPITVTEGTQLEVRQKNLVVDTARAIGLASGGDLASVADVRSLPDHQRAAASVSLGGGSVTIGEAASISTDPRGQIALTAVNELRVDGRLTAPGGSIGLTLNGRDTLSAADLHVGETARISAAGTFVANPPDSRGLTTGTLFNGGSVTLTAAQAGVRVDDGAVIDVSGVSQTVDVVSTARSPGYGRQTLAGHAGTVTVKTQGETALNGTLRGDAGGASAAGGSFVLESMRPDRQANLPAERRIVVTQDNAAVAAAPGLIDAHVNVDALKAGGFEKLRLQSENRIEFQGDATLSFGRGIRLDAPLIDVADAATVLLHGSTVSMGQSLPPRSLDNASWQINQLNPDPSPVLATRRGDAALLVEAGAVDIFGGLTLNGTRQTRIASYTDVRFIGREVRGAEVPQQIGWLHTAGDLEFKAAQLYPATRTDFTVAVAGQPGSVPADGSMLRINGSNNGNPLGDVYSAAGSLSLQADNIVQNGTVKAPHGRVEFKAARSLVLGADSVTSVSGTGLTVLYGGTDSGVTWNYKDGSSGFLAGAELTTLSPAGKRIELSAADIAVNEGARVDMSGGGDVRAVEFVPGNGGDKDITVQDNTYAIIPKSALASIPYDSHLQLSAGSRDPGFGFSVNQGRDNVLYDAIVIGAGSAVPAGEYALLPARFALLPDAHLVQLQTGSVYRNLQDGQAVTLGNGNVVVAGHRSALGAQVRESQSVGVVVLPGSAAHRSSDFTLSGASLLAQNAERERLATPLAPWDAGRMQISNATSLSLQGQFFTTAGVSQSQTPARPAQVDIQSQRMAVVDQVGRTDIPADFLQISGDSLSTLNASVLLGGQRSDTGTGVRITTNAEEVRIANSRAGAVTLPELLIAARDRIDVQAGSVLRASGASTGTSPGVLETESFGSLIRLSNADQARVDRGTVNEMRGDIRIAAGATFIADGAILVDAVGSTQSNGKFELGGEDGVGGSLSLGAAQVSLGRTQGLTGALGGLVLSGDDLMSYASLDALVLRGHRSIDVLGTATLGSPTLASVTLDTPLLRGIATASEASQVSIVARELTLSNSSSVVTASAGGVATLSMSADKLVIGSGAKAVSGFSAVSLHARDVLSTEGKGDLRVAAALNVESPLVQAAGGSQQAITAVDGSNAAAPVYQPFTLSKPSGAVTTTAAPTFGGQIELAGSRVDVSTEVQARSGHITVQALGGTSTAGVVLRQGAVLDAGGQSKNFNGSYVAADGGSVTLGASAGTVSVGAGAVVNVSASADGGSAGRVAVRSAELALEGHLRGNAAADARSGSIEIDLGRLADFSDLNTKLNDGGFAEERRLRLREGNVAVSRDDSVQARRVSITADTGRIDVAGTVGRGAAGGAARVELNAATGLTLAGGSRILANGSDVGARGGEVRAATRDGALVFDGGAEIDVRSGDGGAAGSVVFGVARNAAHAIGTAVLQGTVRRASPSGDSVASVDLEATRSYDGASVGSTLSATRIGQLASDHANFMTSASPQAAALTGGMFDESGALQGARLLGATELKGAGDLSIDATWDLTHSSWLANGNPGTLTIRAVGDLTLRDTLGAPRLATNTSNATTNNNNQNTNHAIRSGDTWGIRLAAGADLSSADGLATVASSSLPGGSGDVLLTGANSNIRTGTGRIDIAAAGDVRMDHISSAIYTAGRIGAADAEVNGSNRWAVDGGSISIRAGGNVAGPRDAKDLWVTEWLRRPRLAPSDFTRLGEPTDWWSYRPRFQQAVGTLAGGDIDIRTGGSVTEFSAVLPSTGRTYRDATSGRRVEVTGGGNLSVTAGGDIVGGSFMIGRGAGRVEAAGNIGVGGDVQLYLMGVSSGAQPEGARIDLVAGGSVELRSVNNPTTLQMLPTSGAAGPSFGPSNLRATRFFTYSSNSAVGLQAKAGDVSVDGVIAQAPTLSSLWRSYRLDPVSIIFNELGSDTAFPASLSVVAFDGDVVGRRPESNQIKTYPSRTATVSVLAGDSISDLSLEISDRDPEALATPFNRVSEAHFRVGNNPNITGNAARSTGALVSAPQNVGDGRITERAAPRPYGVVRRDDNVTYLFDVQALSGSIYTRNRGLVSTMYLPAVSRMRAGVDIADINFTLQNLEPDDVSVLRADTGDLRYRARVGDARSVSIGGPGRLVVQAGRNIDLSTVPVKAIGNDDNPQLGNDSARLTLIAGVSGDVNLARMGDTDADPRRPGGATGVYGEIFALNSASADILDLYAQLATESSEALVLQAQSVSDLAARKPVYARFVSLDTQAPRALQAYQAALRDKSVPLGPTADARAAEALYRLLNAEPDLRRLQEAGSLTALAAAPGGAVYQSYVALDGQYPRLFADYVRRRAEGGTPTAVTPIVFSDALALAVADVVPSPSATGGNIFSYQTSVQTLGGSDIDLWAPADGGNIVAGLTTPRANTTVGVLTLAGGAIRGVLSGDLTINQGKIITALGGDILLYSAAGSIDAGRGAKTSVTTAPPQIVRQPDGSTSVVFSSAATGSGIQTQSFDPPGPRVKPPPGNTYLFAPAGTIDAGEAGIRSGGDIFLNAARVANASDIRGGGTSRGVPIATSGSLASSLASSGANTAGTSKAGEEASAAAAKAAAAAPIAKPNILTVEVMGFGEKNCKEGDKDCFAK